MECKLCREFYNKYPLIENNYGEIEASSHKIDDTSFMSPIQCYFDNNGDNWNCQTVNLIREICYEGQDLPNEVYYQYCENMKYACINIYNIEKIEGMCLWVSWYKQRGKTDALWILDCYDKPRKPTEKELLLIVKYYKNLRRKKL